jgi:hypothetical protein
MPTELKRFICMLGTGSGIFAPELDLQGSSQTFANQTQSKRHKKRRS